MSRRRRGLGEGNLLELAVEVLSGITFGLAVMLLGQTIAAGDEALVHLDDPSTGA